MGPVPPGINRPISSGFTGKPPAQKPGISVPSPGGKGAPPEFGGKAGETVGPRGGKGGNETAGASPAARPFPGIKPPPLQTLKEPAPWLSLPPDKLSAVLLSFVRHFALPLEPGLLSRIRREALFFKGLRREAAGLGAAAAADKGVRLSPETLGEYAAAIDPGSREPGKDTFGDGDRGRDRPGEGGNPDQDRKKPAEINPEDFQKKIEEIEAKRPFLRLLNMIPGKNRGRWVILPFDFSWEGVEFKGTVRILLEGGLSAELKMDRLAVDIVSESRRWLFILDKPGEAGSRMGVNIRPLQPAASRRALERELRERLGPFAAEIRVNDGETPPFADSGVEALPSVNEEV